MENLLALQTIDFKTPALAAGQSQPRDALRSKIPSQILGHYDRLMARGKKGVAIVRNGVCAECHIRVSIGTLGALTFGTDIQLCGNCGRYLYLPEDEPMGHQALPVTVIKTAKRAKKKSADAVR
jgi:hypothetical protein